MRKAWLVFTEYDDIEVCESAEAAKERMKQIINMAVDDEDDINNALNRLEQNYENACDTGYFEVCNGWLKAEQVFMFEDKDFEKEN